ncbi:MAG: bifunctional 5,10-methylenetetrahydrofolate dehydrogenase/5,10-methenyltetrahydrofolate cyclohydrolase [Erysipelotrichaceae bacterium]
MGEIISGKELSHKLRDKIKVEIENFEDKPHLSIVIVGANPASQSYVRGKIKASATIGIKTSVIELPENASEREVIVAINKLNDDDDVHAILVQLPLPNHIDSDKVLETVYYSKDVDGFHPINVANLYLNKECIKPCTPYGIVKMIESIDYDLSGKEVVMIGRSNIVGKPLASMLLHKNATVTICHSKTKDLASVAKRADVLIVAMGKEKFITKDMVKPQAVVIDVGVNRMNNGKLCGDVDFDNVKDVAAYITPVPGGVGPMTITMLMHNTVECFKKLNTK